MAKVQKTRTDYSSTLPLSLVNNEIGLYLHSSILLILWLDSGGMQKFFLFLAEPIEIFHVPLVQLASLFYFFAESPFGIDTEKEAVFYNFQSTALRMLKLCFRLAKA